MTFFYEGVSFFDTAVLIFFLLFVWSLIYRNPAFMIIAIMFVNVALSAMSFYLIELGGYITELGNWSYRTGNLPLHVFYNTLFVSSFFLAYRASGVSNGHLGCQRSQNRLFSLANRLIVFLLVAVIATEYISLFFYGVAIVDGINKVDYAIINPVVGFFGSTATYVSVFLGGLYFHSYKKFYLGIYLAHFLFLILSAQKFSALIVNLSFFFSLYLIRKQYFRMSGKLLYTHTHTHTHTHVQKPRERSTTPTSHTRTRARARHTHTCTETAGAKYNSNFTHTHTRTCTRTHTRTRTRTCIYRNRGSEAPLQHPRQGHSIRCACVCVLVGVCVLLWVWVWVWVCVC